MKKIITAICVTALLASLTACNSETASDSGNSSPAPGSTSSNLSTPENSDNSDSAPEEGVPERNDEMGKPTLEELIGGFSPDVLPLPDGTMLNKTEAMDGMGSADYSILKFDVGVVHYCKPVFQSSYDDPDSFDWENYAFLEPVEEPEENRNVTVRAGDVLENGMTVKSAFTYFETSSAENLYYKLSEVELEGEMTAEGIVYLREEDDYGVYKDRMELYVDTTKCENLPMRYEQYGRTVWTYTFPDHNIALTIDGTFYDIGDINDIDIDVSDVFRDSPFAKVKVTFKDPVLRITESTAVKVMAELVDIEVPG